MMDMRVSNDTVKLQHRVSVWYPKHSLQNEDKWLLGRSRPNGLIILNV